MQRHETSKGTVQKNVFPTNKKLCDLIFRESTIILLQFYTAGETGNLTKFP